VVVAAAVGSFLGLILVLIFGLDPSFAIGQLFGFVLGVVAYRRQLRDNAEREQHGRSGHGW